MASFVKEHSDVLNKMKENEMPENEMPENELIASVNYCKSKPIDIGSLVENWENDESAKKHSFYEPFKIHQLQQYNPIYSVFFELNDKNYNSISFNHKFHIKNLKEVVELKTGEVLKKDVFVKFSPLIDPVRYMTGKYSSLHLTTPDSLKLPQLKDVDAECEPKTIEQKLFSIHNASYIDCFFYYLSSILLNKYDIDHGIDFYGSYLGIQEYFKVNVEEDTEYLENFDFFNANTEKLFYLENWKSQSDGGKGGGGSSHKNKKKIQILSSDNGADGGTIDTSDIIPILDVLDVPLVAEEKHPSDSCIVEMYSKTDQENTSDNSSSSGSSEEEEEESSDEDEDNSLHEDGEEDDDMKDGVDDGEMDDVDDDDDGNEWEDADEEDDVLDDDDDEENESYAYIKNFPVQMICMEKCDGTLDKLFMDDAIDEMSGLSAMFQIIMTLIIYQELFHFTHNDLHTNNITYVETEKTHLYYKYKGVVYRVPTYGRIYKIIDFGRAIYKFQNKTFCSDSFSPHGDASTQYNFPPFYNTKKPLVLPNYSFDLCRLGCSIYDFVIEENTPKPALKHLDDFQRLIYEWCLDDEGKNILYKKSGDERFPGFKLYKAISHRVTQHTPQNQLEKQVFRKFVCKKQKKEGGRKIIDIDAIQAGL
jgi:hypothetical protein